MTKEKYIPKQSLDILQQIKGMIEKKGIFLISSTTLKEINEGGYHYHPKKEAWVKIEPLKAEFEEFWLLNGLELVKRESGLNVIKIKV